MTIIKNKNNNNDNHNNHNNNHKHKIKIKKYYQIIKNTLKTGKKLGIMYRQYISKKIKGKSKYTNCFTERTFIDETEGEIYL